MEMMTSILFFIFGACIGSFLGVLVDRLPRGESIVRGRSHCEFCKKPLGILDLIPVFSFLFLKGKCRYCKKRLSLFYPLIEVTSGILFVFTAFYIGSMYQVAGIMYTIELFYYLFIISSLIVLFFVDLKYGILPFFIIFPATVVTFLYILLNTNYMILNNLLAGLGAFLFFLALFLLTKGRGMGFGDVVYVFLMGLLLGFPGIVFGLYIAFITGAFVSVILILLKRKKMQGSTIAFGPFLVLGTIVVLFWKEEITTLIVSVLLR